MDITDRHYAGYKTCFRLLDELNDLINKGNSKADLQDVVRRLFIVVATNFSRDERSIARYDYFDALDHRALHVRILAETLRLSDRLDRAALPDEWNECASLIVHQLTKSVKNKQRADAAAA
jgi:hemerythrin